ncbi:MAG: ABC transporter permease [Gammaproteobacteria bacterium]|nr:ABC transporter permease [Gammaproteobacteria bacterium]
MEVLRNILGVARRRPARLLYLLTSLGVSFGFIAAVVTIGHASWFNLPSGVADRDYVTVVRRTDAGAESVALVDFDNIEQLAPEVSWFYQMPLYNVRVRDPDGASRPIAAAGASRDYFDQLGLDAVRGSLVAELEGGPAAVLSHRVWREMYDADETIVGTLLDVDSGPSIPIVGVAPPDFAGVGIRWPLGAWILNPPPLSMRDGESEEEAGVRFHRMPRADVFGVVRGTGDAIARLRSLLDDYRFDAEPVRFEREGPVLPPGVELPEGFTTPFVSMDFGIRDSDRMELIAGLETDPDGRQEVAQKTTWLSGMVVLLLTMAFVALLEFLLAEIVSREDEQHIRIAVGATPMDVFRQSVAENGVWIVVVAVVGWFAYRYVLDVLLGIEPFASYVGETSKRDGFVGVGASALLLVAAFLGCVAYLGWFVSRATPRESASRIWTRRATRGVLAFVGLSSLVFVFSLVGRYAGDARMSLGFPNTEVAFVGTSKEREGPATNLKTSVEAVESMPGVRSAARADLMPLEHPMNLRFKLVEILGHIGLDDTPLHRNEVTPGYFATLGVEFLAGRNFETESENEVVVSRSTAEALGGLDEVLGMPLRLSTRIPQLPPREVVVVGVVEDIAYGDYAVPARRIVYSAQSRFFASSSYQRWVIDTEGDVAAVDVLRQMPEFEGWEIHDDGTPASKFREEFLARRSVEIMLSVAAGFALLLALAGMANSLARQIAEDRSAIGIRFALGATWGELARVYSATRVRDLIVAAVLVGVAALVAKLAASAFAAMLELWLLLPALACMVFLVALSGHVIVRRLANRYSVGALLQGFEGAGAHSTNAVTGHTPGPA